AGARAPVTGDNDEAARQTEALGRQGGAAGQRNSALDTHVTGGADQDVPVGRRQHPDHFQDDVAACTQKDASAGGGNRCLDVDVAPTAGHEISVGGGDRLVDIDVAFGV